MNNVEVQQHHQLHQIRSATAERKLVVSISVTNQFVNITDKTVMEGHIWNLYSTTCCLFCLREFMLHRSSKTSRSHNKNWRMNTTIHGHLIDLGGVVLLNVSQDPDVIIFHKVDGHTFTAIATGPTNPGRSKVILTIFSIQAPRQSVTSPGLQGLSCKTHRSKALRWSQNQRGSVPTPTWLVNLLKKHGVECQNISPVDVELSVVGQVIVDDQRNLGNI